MAETGAHPILAELMVLLESEIANPGPIVKALLAYLTGLLTPAQAAECLAKCKAATK